MDPERIRESLERLLAEIDAAPIPDPASRERLRALVEEIQSGISDHHDTIAQSIRDAIGRLESEHPQVASLLNRIMISLGNVGI